MKEEIFFNAAHSPVGAHSSFTFGAKGAKGGFGLELGRPANQNVFIGLDDNNRLMQVLPFVDGAEQDEARRFDHAKKTAAAKETPSWDLFRDNEIKRTFTGDLDQWQAGDLTVRVYNPIMPAPNPETADIEEQKLAYVPAIAIEIIVDNRKSPIARRAIFGYQENRFTDAVECTENSAMTGEHYGLFSIDGEAHQHFDLKNILAPVEVKIPRFPLGSTAVVQFNAPAQKLSTFRLVAVFHRAHEVTTSWKCRYYYSRFFPSLKTAANYALNNFEALKNRSRESSFLHSKKLSNNQRFQLAHAVSSYYSSTQLLSRGGKAYWLVNEGEYRMMNTFDLTADQVFYELEMNPWTVFSELELFYRRYSYTDQFGISFTHDMGVKNRFTPKGTSSYECPDVPGCFSYMSAEQLTNWILCCSAYAAKNELPQTWDVRLNKVFKSLANRCPDGVLAENSSKCKSGHEITTFDSLDRSLGEAKNNTYLGMKCIVSLWLLSCLFEARQDFKRAKQALELARRGANKIINSASPKGVIPAILDCDHPAAIIPVIEALAFPWVFGRWNDFVADPDFARLIAALKKHLSVILKPGICLYSDGGWKLSSTADNSWLSKIYLSQFVARELLKLNAPEASEIADNAHTAWLLKEENLYWGWSDQMTSGVAKGSKFYPRGVTAILWTKETSAK